MSRIMELTTNNGLKMPIIGVGTYLMRDEINLSQIIEEAFRIGYRLIDTAQVYQNESYIGSNIMQHLDKFGLKREDVFLTTKLAPGNQGKGIARKTVLRSLEQLGTPYLDLVLIHWPGTSSLKPSNPKNGELRKGSWEDLEELQKEGLIRSIGVSNYTIKHLEQMKEYSTIKPAVNQIEVHPLYYDKELIDYCQSEGIIVQAYSSLGAKQGWPVLRDNSVVKQIAAKYNWTVAQVLLKWALQHGLAIIPKTSNKENLATNYTLWDHTLTPEDMEQLDSLNKMKKFCWDPSLIA